MKAWGRDADADWHDLGQCDSFEAAELLANAWEARTGGVILKLYVGDREP
jgi:hypothetical protein